MNAKVKIRSLIASYNELFKRSPTVALEWLTAEIDKIQDEETMKELNVTLMELEIPTPIGG